MSHRKDTFSKAAQHLLQDLQYAGESIHLMPPSENGLELHRFKLLQDQVLAEIQGNVFLNPISFRANVAEAVSIVQKSQNSTAIGFGANNEMPYEHFETNPDTGVSRVRFVIPTLSLLHRYPQRNFPSSVEQGIDLDGNDLQVILLDPGTQRQEIVRPDDGIIKPSDPIRLRLVVGLASWALDPQRIRSHQ